MKAAQLRNYSKNTPRVDLVDVPKPTVLNYQVLIKVLAAGVNPLDNMVARGEVKLIAPYKTPLIMGNEVVGLIEYIGSEVTQFAVGKRVFGRLPLDSIGAFAEYVAVDAAARALDKAVIYSPF